MTVHTLVDILRSAAETCEVFVEIPDSDGELYNTSIVSVSIVFDKDGNSMLVIKV